MPFQEYEVGKYYKIPCVRVGSVVPACARKGGWIPVLLPWHEDASIIGFPEHHYHYDPRFLSKRAYREFSYGLVLSRHPGMSGFSPRIANTSQTLFDGEIVYRRLTYKRPFPPYRLFEDRAGREMRNGWPSKLETAYAHDHLRNGVCPHRGINLTTCPVVYGVVTCPGHGLRWNVETGKLVRRWPEREKDAA